MAFAFPQIVPTARAAVLIALAAPFALLIAAIAPAAWIAAPALGLGLLLLVLLDAGLAGRLAVLRVIAPDDCEVGDAFELAVLADITRGRPGAVTASLALDPRLAPGGRCELALHFDAASASWQGAAKLVPSRRGTGALETVWLRWTGPLGLGARLHRQELASQVRVWPNISAVRSPALQAFLRDAQTGLVARRIIVYKHVGDKVAMGERIGLIKFGSRMDIFFGPEWDMAVKVGERVWAASSIIARRRRS